mmetsp:Transcript_67149/g.218598  ORF Transcript_67149/g.218598 Transcript_67149/m.218598 type:complete len:236 (+) Transcript_67149:328-1035(+)
MKTASCSMQQTHNLSSSLPSSEASATAGLTPTEGTVLEATFFGAATGAAFPSTVADATTPPPPATAATTDTDEGAERSEATASACATPEPPPLEAPPATAPSALPPPPAAAAELVATMSPSGAAAGAVAVAAAPVPGAAPGAAEAEAAAPDVIEAELAAATSSSSSGPDLAKVGRQPGCIKSTTCSPAKVNIKKLCNAAKEARKKKPNVKRVYGITMYHFSVDAHQSLWIQLSAP